MFKNHIGRSSLLDRFEHPSRSDKELELELYQQSMHHISGDDRGLAARRIQELEATID